MRLHSTPLLQQPWLTGAVFLSLAAGSAAIPLIQRATIANSTADLHHKYDYVVIGGGTSGLTVANRLTENPNTTVLVIEYGPLDAFPPGTLVPGLAPPKEYSRNYMSVPQKGTDNRQQGVYTAGVVGGGTVINGMFFTRGSALDYDDWASVGNPGWGWADLLPYFKKSENFTPPTQELADNYPVSGDLSPHGTDGPIGSSFPAFTYPVLKYFYSAWNKVGIISNPQPNAGSNLGAIYSTLSLTAWNQSRSAASSGYFEPINGKRPNFHLIPLHNVNKILIDAKSKQATGVQFFARNHTNNLQTVQAGKEVILAAGAVRSPGLLQLSGVGPKSLLNSLGIPVIEDLPGVGYNFHDQPSFFAGVSYDYSKYPFPSPNWIQKNQTYADDQLKIYYENRTGPYTQVYLSGTSVAFLPLPNVTDRYQQIIDNAHKVDLQSTLPAGVDPTVLLGYQGQVDQTLKSLASYEIGVHEAAASGTETIPLVLVKPLSRGSILINSTDSLADPVIDYGTFNNPTDVEIMVAILEKFQQFVAAEPWSAVGLTATNPAANITANADLEATIRQQSQSTWSHPVGTCGMHPRAKGGVVDTKLRVYGIKRLRVVDASIMPIIPATHTSSTVYAVAEKAADIIKSSRKAHGGSR